MATAVPTGPVTGLDQADRAEMVSRLDTLEVSRLQPDLSVDSRETMRVGGSYLHFVGLQFLRTQRAASAEIQVPSGGVPNSRS